MAQKGKTKVFLAENAVTTIYTHVEKEIATGTIDGANQDFIIATTPVAITGIVSGSPQFQYVDGSNNYLRKDILVHYRLNNADTVVDTSSNALTISGSTITFATAPTTSEADSVLVTSSHTPSVRTDEITATTHGGGARSPDYVVVQGGERVRIQKVQEEKTVTFEVLSVDNGFVRYVNGNQVQETIAGVSSGSDILQGSVGAQTRSPSANTIVLKVDDPETDNDRLEIFYNVTGVTDEGSLPSDGAYTETCSFQCAPQDYCRLTRLVGQG